MTYNQLQKIARNQIINDGRWDLSCNIALSPQFKDSFYNYGYSNIPATLSYTGSGEPALEVDYSEIGNLGSQNMTLTTSFMSGSDVTTSQRIAGFIGNYSRCEITISSGFLRFIFGLDTVPGSREINIAVSANAKYVVSMAVDRVANNMMVYINGKHYQTVNDPAKIITSIDFVPTINFISGKSGVREFFGVGPYFTFFHMLSLESEYIKAIHKNLGA